MAFFDRNKSNRNKEVPEQNSSENNELTWLKNLEKMRENRKESYSPNSLLAENSHNLKNQLDKTFSVAKKSPREYLHETEPPIRKKIYQYYLNKWAKEQNQTIENDQSGTQIILANKWTLQAENVLLKSSSVSEEEVSTLFFNTANELEEVSENQIENVMEKKETDRTQKLTEQMIKVTVVKPEIDVSKKVCVIDEAEFIELIKKQLKPHLQSLLEGMIKNMLLSNYEIMLSCIQKEIQTEIPNLIDEMLEYGIKSFIKK